MTASEARTIREYRLVNADGHINEPPDLWTSRLPSKYKDRVPYIKSFDEGDAWIIEGVEDPINFGMNSCAGLPASEQKAWIRWDHVRRGGWDPAARLEEMQQDRVDAEVLYPTPRLSAGILNNPDRDFSLLLVKAYNDWLSEYCSYAPNQLVGAALLPHVGVKEAVTEFERVMEMPGIRCAIMACYPHGTTTLESGDDALFDIVAQSGTALQIHVGLVDQLPRKHATKIPGDVRFYDAPKRMLELMWAGVLDRYPELVVNFVEVDCGWVPYFNEQTDNRYFRLAAANDLQLQMAPSEYFAKHYRYTFITDTYAVRNRHAIGVENMMWSSDYPHMGADWPNSWRTVQAAFSGVPKAEQSAILAGNAVRMYGL